MAGIGKLLKKAAKKKSSSKKKSNTPEVDRPDLTEAISKWKEGSKMEKDGKAMKAQAEGVILPEAEEERVKASMGDGEYHSSVKINGEVTVGVQGRYTKIETDCEDEIKEIVGDKYDGWFKEDTKVSLKPALLNDEGAMGKIIEAVGEENFERFFDVAQTIVPTRSFHEARSTDADTKKKFEELSDEGLIKPYKAAVKKA